MLVAPEPRSRAILPIKSLAAFIAAMISIAGIGALTYQSSGSRARAALSLQRTEDTRRQLYAVLSAMQDAETGQRGYLLSADASYLQPYERARVEAPRAIGALRAILDGEPRTREQLDQLEGLAADKFTELEQTIALRRSGDAAGAQSIMNGGRGRLLMDQLRAVVAEMLVDQSAQLARRTDAWQAATRWSLAVTVVGTALLVVMLLLVGLFSSRDYRALTAELWARRVKVALGAELQGDPVLASLADKILRVLAAHLDAQVGAIYVPEGDELRRVAGYALAPDAPELVKRHQGLIGQAAVEHRVIVVRELPADYPKVTSASGAARPRTLALVPAVADGVVHGVVELGFFAELDGAAVQALERAGDPIAAALRAARDRGRLEELLAETQRQAEELQAQQEELRVSNEELEQQSRSLQLSQVQLETQQAELEELNAQLEEQTKSLEGQRDELERAGAALQRTNEYKSQFLANMSHELRTPLNSTLILAKLLADNRERNLTDEQIAFARTIHAAGNDLLTLINDILDLSKIEAGMLDVRIEVVDLRRLIDELRTALAPVARDKHLELITEIEPDAPAVIDTDPTRLNQILKNLLANALKFTERGRVTVTVAATPAGVRFAVADTGIGIAADQHELIFDAFRQGDGASTRRHGGTGLGLSISRDLARLLGGEIAVESAPGRGSTFTLTLPRTRDPVAVEAGSRAARAANRSGIGAGAGVRAGRDHGGDRDAGRAPGGERAGGPGASDDRAADHRAGSERGGAERGAADRAGGGAERANLERAGEGGAVRPAPFADDRERARPGARSLLIVEDDLGFAQALAAIARELEFLVIAADHGDDAVALARRHQPSAILLDVVLPDRSGLSVLDTLKHDPRTRHIPVQMVSAADHSRTALAMGAIGYAIKPVEREQLVDAIRQLEARFASRLRRILIVEDDPVLRASSARLLAADNVETIGAGTAAEALDLLERQTFDCMVLDLSLPDRSGLELLEEVSRSPRHGFPPVIVYTGRSLAADELRRLESLSRSIVVKGARSPERLLDEVTLFLHQVETELPPDRQTMLRDARNREAVFDGRHVLVVEDDVRNIFALSSVLQPRGAIVDVARNGREALEALERRPDTDLVLMDVMMPEMDGLEATRRVRAQPRFARLPIIALTAKAMADDRQKCLDAGANDYIAKPLDVDKLLSLARVWIRK